MVKTVSVVLRRELKKHGVDLLDVYRYKSASYLRVKLGPSGNVKIIEIKKHVDTIPLDKIPEEVEEILKSIRK